MNKKCYVRFWSNDNSKRSMPILFPSFESAKRFVEKWQHFGGIRRFEDDYLGDQFEPIPSDVSTPYLFGKNNAATAKVLNSALWGKPS